MDNCPWCDKKAVGVQGRVRKEDYTGLTFERNLRYGYLYDCKNCGAKWFLNEKDNMWKIIDFNKLEKWNEQPLIPSNKILDPLKQIGSDPLVSPSFYEKLTVPCKCRLKNGKIIEHCIFSFQNHPILGQEDTDVCLAYDVEEVYPSEDTLSREVRVRLRKAIEHGMNYYPTLGRVKNGENFIFIYPLIDFFNYDKWYDASNDKERIKKIANIKANDIEIEEVKDTSIFYGKKLPYFGEFGIKRTTIIADLLPEYIKFFE